LIGDNEEKIDIEKEDEAFSSYKKYVLKFSFRLSEPSHPHEQLLRVIPPLNKYLIPFYLHEEFEKISKKSNTFKIDKAGKREEWEAVTIVDFVELNSKIIYEKS